MNSKQVYDLIHSAIPDLKIYLDHPLATYTTLKIGGPADVLTIVENTNQLIALVKLLYQTKTFFLPNYYEEEKVFLGTQSSEGFIPEGREYPKKSFNSSLTPITFIGNGSNLVISDKGIRGLVVKIATSEITIHPDQSQGSKSVTTISAQRSEGDAKKFLDFSKLDYDETGLPQKKVTLSAGVPLPYAINFLINQGLTGLQWFAYIPGTIGGAVFGNIHGGSHHFSEYVDSVEIFDFTDGQLKVLSAADIHWQYDRSSFQTHPNWLIVSVTLHLFLGDKQKAQEVVKMWIEQKRSVQSMTSAGSVFKNPSLEDCQRLWGEQKSTGWIVDQVLGLKGVVEGQAQISPQHANFIINTGQATAADYLKLVSLVQSAAKEKLGLTLEPEVKFLGEF